MSDAVVVALITGFFGILIVLVQKGRKENVRDHGYVAEKLDSLSENLHAIDKDLMAIEGKMDGHISDHARGILDLSTEKTSAAKSKTKNLL